MLLPLAFLLISAPADLDTLFKQAAQYEFGQSRAVLEQLSEEIRNAHASPAAEKDMEKRLIALVESTSTPAAKDYACRELSVIGTPAAVPPIEKLLPDSRLGGIALYALERIPGPESTAAISKALASSSGRTKAGLINALARRGVKHASYAASLKDPDPGIAGAAAFALALTGAAPDARLLIEAGKPDEALRLAERLGPAGLPAYKQLYQPAQPETVRVAALGGMARLEGKAALPVIEQAVLKGTPALQARAIQLAPTPVLAKAFPQLAPPAQVRVIAAISDSLPLVTGAAKSPDVSVRLAAIEKIGATGTAAEVSLLADLAANTQDPEQSAARTALYRIKGPGIDPKIVDLLSSAELKTKLELIRACGERGIQSSSSVLLAAAKDSDREVRREAIRALREIAAPGSMPDLVALLTGASSQSDRREAERTVATVLRRSDKAPVQPLLAAYSTAPTPEAKVSLLAVMGQAGRDETLSTIRQELKADNADIQRAAILALTEWPSQVPAADLLAYARGGSNATLQVLALRGYIRLVAAPSEKTPAEIAKQLADALPSAKQPEEKKLILAALQKFVCAESLAVARTMVEDPAVSSEAKLAVERLERSLTFRR